MGKYAVQTSESEGKNFFAGAEFPQMRETKTASAAVSKYAPVVLDNTGKIKPVTAEAGSDSTYTAETTGLYGIALEDIANGENGAVLLTGEVLASALALSENVDISALEVPFRNIGIFLK